jgi:uncharacterized protein
MNTHSLPDFILPQQLVAQEATLEGTVSLAELPLLVDSLYDDQGQVRAQLQFGKDEEGLAYIKGSLHAELNLLCQRCLRPFTLTLDVPISLSLVTNELAVKSLPTYYDPLFVSKEPISLRGIIEEELLLNLPLVAKHEPEKCSIKLQNLSKTGDNSPQ